MRTSMSTLCMLLAACGGTGTTPTPQATSMPPPVEANAAPRPAAVTPETTPVTTHAPGTGAITGTLSYPSEELPAMRVCAFELAEGAPYCISSAPGQREYRIDGVPLGDYQVLAYPREGDGAPGGYTGCVDELNASCTDHDLRVVVVAAGKTMRGIDPADFYAGDAGVDWPTAPEP